MNQGMVNTVISAIVGGVVGAGVVFFAGGQTDFKELKVAKLTITEEATVLNKEGKPEVVLKDGSVLAENVVFAKKMIARQLQAHAMVANRIFATPDDLMTTKMEEWKFYAEIGASTEAGGEIVVRSANGPALVNKAATVGSLFRMGYDPEFRPQMLAINHASRSPMEINYQLSETQRQLMVNNLQGAMPAAAGNYNSPSTTNIQNREMLPSPSVATQPSGTTVN